MKTQIGFKDPRLLEILEYLDEEYVAEVVDNLKLGEEQPKPFLKKTVGICSFRGIAALAACALLLGALIPVISYVTENFHDFVALLVGESTETESELTESGPVETTFPIETTATPERTETPETTATPERTEPPETTATPETTVTPDTTEEVRPGHNGSEGLAYSIVSGDSGSYAVFTGIGTCTDKDIVIASEYNGYPVIELGKQALRGCNWIKSVKLPESVTVISEGFFYQCTSLETIILPDSLEVIGEGAFAHCSALKDIKLPPSLERIESDAFSGCSLLEKLDIPESVSYIGPQFAEGTLIDSVHIPKNVTDIGYGRFGYGNFGTNVKKVTVDPDHPRYTLTGNCLIDREQKMLLRAFGEPKFPTDGSIETISKMAFYLVDFKMNKLILPEGLIKINWYNSEAFAEIEELYIPSTCVDFEGYDFAECNNLKKVTVSAGNPRFYSAGNCIIEKETGILVVGSDTSTIPKDGSILAIGEFAFCGRKGLNSIRIPEGVKSIHPSAFPGCTSLTEIILPESLESIGDAAFFGCHALEKIELGKNVREILIQAFEGCSSLREIVFGGTMEDWYKVDAKQYVSFGTSLEKITCSDGVIDEIPYVIK